MRRIIGLLVFGLVLLILEGCGTLSLTLSSSPCSGSDRAHLAPFSMLALVVLAMAFLCEYFDSSLGMGYGTTLTPLLLIMGFSPLQVVPAVLFSEFLTGIIAGLFHHRFGNIRLGFRRDGPPDPQPGSPSGCHAEDARKRPRQRLKELYIASSCDSKVILLLAGCGIVGTLIAVFVAISIPKIVLELYIGAMILAIGMLILLRGGHSPSFSWKRLIAIGLIGSFNKGISGGGYGPLVTGGQVLSGREARSAVGSTSFAEGLVCLVGLLTYIATKGNLYWNLAIPLVIGAVMSTPLAALTVRRIDDKRLRMAVGLIAVTLGGLTLIRALS